MLLYFFTHYFISLMYSLAQRYFILRIREIDDSIRSTTVLYE